MEERKASKMRIYVGGLGEAMTEDDLKRIFHSVGGVVDTIDFLRTKSRCFAYVDFLPSSLNSISKLFSTYNGCAWKGGKLRLEKAKEHYLVRLRREWEEDAQFVNTSNGDVNLEESAPESFEEVAKSEEIQIFFPSLGMVQSLPISGTGTHKYSFPDVEVPHLPMHFCDCEEHTVYAPPTGKSKGTKTRDLDAENGGVDEEEIQLMNAVMKKLLERQNTSETNYNGTVAVKDREDDTTILSGTQKFEDSKVDSDEDNLVLNVMAGDPDTKTMPFNNENRIEFKAPKSSKGVTKDQKSNSRVPNKKRKSIISETDRNVYVSSIPSSNEIESARPSRPQPVEPAMQIHSSCSQKPSWKALIRDTSSVAFSISHILPSIPSAGEGKLESDGLNPTHSTPIINRNFATDAVLGSKSEDTKFMKSLAESQQTISKVTLNKGRGSSWLQKSSWTQLVSEENNTSFSISQILPNNTSEEYTQIESNIADVNNNAESRNDDKLVMENKHRIAEDGSTAFPVRKENTAGNNVKKDQQPVVQRSEPSPNQVIESHMPLQTDTGDVKSGETCPFMRNSRSVAEWAKIKAALTGGSKNKKQRR